MNELAPRLFGRDPALWLQAVSGLLVILVGLGLPGLTDSVAAAIMALIAAALTTWQALLVRPVAPTVMSGLIVALAPLGAYFGLHLAQSQIATLTAGVAGIVALIVRSQSTPVYDPAPI